LRKKANNAVFTETRFELRNLQVSGPSRGADGIFFPDETVIIKKDAGQTGICMQYWDLIKVELDAHDTFDGLMSHLKSRPGPMHQAARRFLLEIY
jgi:hypothetical protein